VEKYLEMNLPSAVTDQLPIFSFTTFVKNLSICEFYIESKINRIFFQLLYFLSIETRLFPKLFPNCEICCSA